MYHQPIAYLKKIALIISITFILAACHQSDINGKNYPTRTNSILDRANLLLSAGKIHPSLHFVDSAYRAFPEAGPADLWNKYNYLYKFYLNDQPDTTKCKAYIDSMILVLRGRESLYKTEYAHTLFAKGDLLMSEKKYTEAFGYYYNGRSYAQKNLDSCSLSAFTYQLAMVRYNQLQFREAIPYFKQTLKETNYCETGTNFTNRFMLPQNIMRMTGLSYAQLDQRDSSIYYYKRTLAFINRMESLFPQKKTDILIARGMIYGNLGGAYMWRNIDDKAEYYLTESIRINDQLGFNNTDAIGVRFTLAYLYIRASKLDSAARLIREIQNGLKIIRKPDMDEYWVNLYSIKRTYYDKVPNVDSAYYYQTKFFTYVDSLRKAQKDLRKADMEGAFKSTEQQYKLELLNRDDKLKTVYLLAIITFAIMAIIILLVIWGNLKRTNKANKQISEKNTHMQKALSALEQSQEDNTRMMRIVAHDLRNPIGAITSVASLMLEESEHSEDDRMMLELIKTSGQNSLELVSDLLQVHTRTEELKKEPVDLYQMLCYCIDLLNFKAETKGQQLILKALPVIIPLNREKMWRVVSNLITNAIKFSPSGSHITVQLWEKPQSVVITVQDHGIGIPMEMSSKIFDMFTEAKRLGTAGEQPFGLGLAISKQIVEAHGGKIWFDSMLGNGTTFYVELPQP